MAELYDRSRQVLLQHYRQSRFRGKLNNPAIQVSLSNPLCGDQIKLAVIIESDNKDQKIVMRFEAQGCVLSQAMASLFLEYIEHMSVTQIALISQTDYLEFVRSTVSNSDFIGGDKPLIIGPTRQRCVLLIFDAVKNIVSQLAQGNDAVSK